jgi:hypothetical protein
MAQVIIIILIVRILIALFPPVEAWFQNVYRQLKQKFSRTKNASIFEAYYIEPKAFYIKEFKATPCISSIGDVDAAKVYQYIDSGLAGKVLAIYQRNYYSWQHEQQHFGTTVFKLENKVLIKLSDEYAEVLFSNTNYEYANSLIKAFTSFKMPEKEEPFEINIITQTSTGLDLKQLEIKPTVLDIDLYYNDDFKPVDEVIRKRLEKDNDKGIILLHGLPGTGKTTYLRHLIGSMKKKVLFISPAVAGNLMNPEFIDLLIDNPNAILIIEDAENIIMDRKFSSNSSVSNLLNISDGLLSDCLNVQIICTFNSALSMVDSALLRKGRLIAKYEFGKLSATKSQRLSNHLGFAHSITQPMTIAEIANPDEKDNVIERTEVFGFRRQEVTMN